MAVTYKYVQGDTRPQLQVTLKNETTNEPIDLTGATVTLHFKAAGETSILFSRNFTVTNATGGVAVLQWQSGDLDQEAGAYQGEIEIVTSTGQRETIFDILKFKIREDFA
jgi:hypothetical protein